MATTKAKRSRQTKGARWKKLKTTRQYYYIRREAYFQVKGVKKMAKKSKGTKYRKTITIGRDINGKAIRKDFYARTKHELNEKIDAYKRGMLGGAETVTKIRFEDWALTWLESYKEGQIEHSSYKQYRYNVNTVCKYFGKALLSNIKEADVMRFFKANGNRTTSYLRGLYTTLNQIFEKAVANELISKNPMANLKKPVGTAKGKVKKAYSYEEYRKAIDFAKTHPDGLGPFIMLKTGVRISELLGLKGTDIDFEKGLIHIRRTSTRDGVKNYGKTKSAMRTIPIDDECRAFLNSHLICHGDNFLFLIRGKTFNPVYYRNEKFVPFQRDLLKQHPELPMMTPHEYRHTFGTLLYQSGTEFLTLSRIMGHANVLITQKTYVHDTLDDIIKNVRFPVEPSDKEESFSDTV